MENKEILKESIKTSISIIMENKEKKEPAIFSFEYFKNTLQRRKERQNKPAENLSG